MRVISNIRDLEKIQCYHVGFIPYRFSSSGPTTDTNDVEVLLPEKRGQLGIIGGGAKASKGETVLQCLRREIKEELNMELNLDLSRVTAMLFENEDAIKATRNYSVTLWYQDDNLERYLVFNEARHQPDDEVTSVAIYPSWNNLLWLTEPDIFVGAAEWSATPMARILAYRNLEFFDIQPQHLSDEDEDDYEDRPPTTITTLLLSGDNSYLEPYFTQIYPWLDFKLVPISKLVVEEVSVESLPPLEQPEDKYKVSRVFLLPYSDQTTLWLPVVGTTGMAVPTTVPMVGTSSSNRGHHHHHNNKRHLYQLKLTFSGDTAVSPSRATAVFPSRATVAANKTTVAANKTVNPTKLTVEAAFNRTIKALELTVSYVQAVIHDYGGERLALIFVKLSKQPVNKLFESFELTKVETNNSLDYLAWKMLRRVYDQYRHNTISPVPRGRYPAAFSVRRSGLDAAAPNAPNAAAPNARVGGLDGAYASTVASQPLSIDNMFIKQRLVDNFRTEHRRVTAELLEEDSTLEISDSYRHNVLGLEVINTYLRRQHPLLRIFYNFVDHGVDINDCVADITAWCCGRNLHFRSSSPKRNFVDIDLYYAIRDKLKATAAAHNLDTTEYTQYYFNFRVY